MTAPTSPGPMTGNPALGIGFVLLGVTAISINDMLIKQLSGGYPLHQMVFIRSGIGIFFSLMLVQMEGGLAILRTKRPLLHLTRGLLVVLSNMTFFGALAVLPLADATALFFVAPLMITLLSIPMLGEKVGPMRLGAVVVGLMGVVIMMKPWQSAGALEVSRAVLLLPVAAALTYALFQILTRKLGASTRASAMAVYIQGIFMIVSLGVYAVAGDGHLANGVENASLVFLLREWVWPQGTDIWLFLGLGLNSAVIGYSLSQAYRLTDAATVAPFEYVGLPLAVFWGWIIWGDLPDLAVTAGIVLIVGSGLFVFLRERQRKRRLVSAQRVHRRY
ncbi:MULTISPECIES: DMT family transporter [Sediminimonas]|uniref:DMT family transporter n=1 Tax=Sediminimonas TaxID=659427 RepID=UPI0003F7EF3F|nr:MULTISPECIES: DMT family transporter [Sediminimonas]MDR9484558.1 DMT family transporter [Sediminimonas sp.]